jgi:hypothetical protein
MPDAAGAPGEPRRGRIPWPLHRELRIRATLWGGAAALALLLVYVATLALANSLEHAVSEMGRLWFWMLPLVLGFALQVGLFAYGRRAARIGGDLRAGGVVASSGASALSMVACCAHHLTDVLPLVGLAGAALLLSDYQHLFLLVGVLSNAVGLLYVMGMLAKHRLFPDERSLLSVVLSRPLERAFPAAAAGAALVLIVAIFVEFL